MLTSNNSLISYLSPLQLLYVRTNNSSERIYLISIHQADLNTIKNSFTGNLINIISTFNYSFTLLPMGRAAL